MAIIQFEKPATQPLEKDQPETAEFEPTAADIKSIIETAERARGHADRIGMKFEAYLLHTAILALTQRLDEEG